VIAAVALAGVNRREDGRGSQFRRQTIPDFQVPFDLTCAICDFAARCGHINAASAQLLAANFAFDDVHR
jgi:outer membrane protein